MLGITTFSGVAGLTVLSQHKNSSNQQNLSQTKTKTQDGNVLGEHTQNESPSASPSVAPDNEEDSSNQLASTFGSVQRGRGSSGGSNTTTQKSNTSFGTTSSTTVNSNSTPSPTVTPTGAPASSSNTSPTTNTPETVENPPSKTTLEIFTGSNVTVTDPHGNTKPGVNKQVVEIGSTVTTGGATQAQLVYPTGGVTRLDENTSITFNEEPGATAGGSISIIAGRTWQRVLKVVGLDSYETDTPSALASVRGTSYGHGIELDEEGNPADRIITLEGKVAVKCKKSSDPEVFVTPNDDLKLKCNLKNALSSLNQISAMTQSEIDWVVQNLIKDEQLKARFKHVAFGDPTNPEAVLSDNLPPDVDAGKDRIITFGDSLTLSGSVSDDHLPFKAKPVTLWVALDDNSLVQADEQTDLRASVYFGKPGVYHFKLIASDLVAESSDTVTVTVLPKNTAPIVQLESDKTVYTYEQVTVHASVTDDGLPLHQQLSYDWSMKPSPNNLLWVKDEDTDHPTGVIKKAGVYTIELEVSDGNLTSEKASMQLTVIDPPDLSISSVIPHSCSLGSSCAGTTVLEVNGDHFNEYTRVKLKLNGREILGLHTGGDDRTQILTDFSNLQQCKNYDVVTYVSTPYFDTRTATFPFTFDPDNSCN